MPLRARDAIRGSPSPWKVFAMMPTQVREREERDRTSVPLSVVIIVVWTYHVQVIFLGRSLEIELPSFWRLT